MVFREPAARAVPAGRVLHGPFPARWGLLVSALLVAFVAGVLVPVGLQTQRFACARGGACFVDGRPVFAAERLRGAHTEIRVGSKNTRFGVVVLELDGGATMHLMQVEPNEADAAVDSIRAALRSGGAVDVRLHGPRWLAGAGAVGIVIALALLLRALASMGRFVLTVSPGAVLRVRRSVLGVPLGERTFPLERVERVVFERGVLKPFLQQRGEPLIPAGRLRLRYASGDERPLSPRFYPGTALHLRAAAALRRVLELDPNDADDRELATLPLRTWPASQRFGYVWMGVTCGSLVGMLILGLALLAVGVIHVRDSLDGWFVAAGAIPGALGGAGIALHATRPRLPR
jgi:hypothetical protein